jgi:hypothetical protein
MNLLKRASAHPTTAFGLPILLSAAILVAHGGGVRAADKMVGGEFATKGIVMSGCRPLIKGFFGVALIVGAVMSSAFRAENWIRWP